MVVLPGLIQLCGSLTEKQIREGYIKSRSYCPWEFEHTPSFIKYMEKHFGQSIFRLDLLSTRCLPPYPPEDFVFNSNVHPDIISLPYDSYNQASYLVNKQFIADYREIKSDGMLAGFIGPLQPFKFIPVREHLKKMGRQQRISFAVLLDLATEIPVGC